MRLTLTQGDTWSLQLAWLNPLPGTNPPQPDPASPVDLTGWTARMQLRERPGSPPALSLTSSPPAGITVDGTAGTVSVRAAPSQTETIPPGVWLWEIEVDNTIDRQTLATGTLTVEPQVAS